MKGTASYGASLNRALTGQNLIMVEVKPPRRQARAGVGKTAEIDATAAAMSILGKDLEQLLQPRSDGARAAISVLLASRHKADQQPRASRNALNALQGPSTWGIGARKALTDRQWPESAIGVPPPTASSSRSPARKRPIWQGTSPQQRPA